MKSMFLIRDKTTGLFSNGGYIPRFINGGKAWSRVNFARSHINCKKVYYDRHQIEIVEMKLVEIGVLPIEK